MRSVIVATLTVSHPMITDKDAANYVARLGLVGTRMGEAVADARRLAAKDMIPPRFILLATKFRGATGSTSAGSCEYGRRRPRCSC